MSDHHIHHVTAITDDLERNFDFYSNVLGLRFIKKTVNFDDPSAYHLYYADAVGTPGTVMTFFHWVGLPNAREGTRSISAVLFSVPSDSLSYWQGRLSANDITCTPVERFGARALQTKDPDGLTVFLIETEERFGVPWKGSSVPEESQISHIHGVEFTLKSVSENTHELLRLLGYSYIQEDKEKRLTRLSFPYTDMHALYVVTDTEQSVSRMGDGSIHHVAFRVSDENEQDAFRETVSDLALEPTPVIERFYFRSVYFPLPEGVLFEVATDDPGFLVDESEENLGTTLCLPPQYEEYRERIEAELTPFEPLKDTDDD